MLQLVRERIASVPAQRCAGLTTVGRCLPAGRSGEPIAGDFYDVFALDSTRLLVAVGDVAGHGTSAAGRMTQLRADIRRLALLEVSPAGVLSQLDQLQCQRGPEEVATLWLGMYEARTEQLNYSSSGHPPLVLAGLDGRARLLAEASSPPLGTGEVGKHAEVDNIEFPEGALLVGYSDGLVERAGCDLGDQIELLRRLVEEAYDATLDPSGVEALVDSVLRQLVPCPLTSRDDVCILAIHRPVTSR